MGKSRMANCNPQIRMVTGFVEVLERKEILVAGADLNRRPLGLCDLTHLSIRVGLYLHPRETLAIQSLRLPSHFGAWFGIAVSLTRRRFHRL
jgi:hypothetical protein